MVDYAEGQSCLQHVPVRALNLCLEVESNYRPYIEPFVHQALNATRFCYRCLEGSTPFVEVSRDHAPDLTVSQVTAHTLSGSSADGQFRTPLRARFVIDLGVDESGPLLPSRREQRRHRQRVVRSSLSYHVSRSQVDFEFFLNEMYIPTMRARHKSAARIVTGAKAQELLDDNGFILQVLCDDSVVAGILCQVSGSTCNARLVGLLGGDSEYLRLGAIKSGNHFLIEWAERSGLSRIDFQTTEPFASKGTFQSKRHLGARIEPDYGWEASPAELLFTFDGYTPRLYEFLVQNPPVTIMAAGGLEAIKFVAGSLTAVKEVPIECPGLSVRNEELPRPRWLSQLNELEAALRQ